MEGNKSIREKRRREILNAAKKVFIDKPFEAIIMEDIISETSLSRGGFYYYYKNTVDILHDLMREGMAYRISEIKKFMATYSGNLDKNALAEMMVDKMLDKSDLMSIYVIYLQAAKNNKELKKLYSILVDEALYSEFCDDVGGVRLGDFNYNTTNFIIYFMNTVMLGCEVLDARDNFVKNRDFFVEVVKIYFDFFDKGKIQ